MQALKFILSDISLHINIPKLYPLKVESSYTRFDGGRKANAYGDIKVLYNKLQSAILFQGDDQLNTEL
jgi:hypothetical protein